MLPQTNSKLSVEDLCNQGSFEEASRALEGWRGVGLRPSRNGQADAEYAEALQWAAVISVQLSLSRQTALGDSARDMLTESARLSGEQTPIVWLGICYYRCGEYNEAEAVLSACLESDLEPATRFLALRNLAVVKTYQSNYTDALRLISEAEELLDNAPIVGRGKLYLQRGLIHRKLGQLEATITDYKTAEQYFEAGQNRNYEAAVLLNLSRVFLEKQDHLRAHVYAERAVSIFESIGDRLHGAKGWDEIARIHLAEKKYDRAERAARKAVSLIERGDQSHVLAECLITLGAVLAERGIVEAESALGRAAEISALIGDHAQVAEANQVRLRMLQNGKKLITSFSNCLRPMEHAIIKDALIRNGGVIKKAAADLEIHYNTLIKKIQAQYPDLLPVRRPIRSRRKSVIGVNSHKPRR